MTIVNSAAMNINVHVYFGIIVCLGICPEVGLLDHSHSFILKQKCKYTCRAQGTMLSAIWQPGWEGSLRETEYMSIYGWASDIIITLLISYTPI